MTLSRTPALATVLFVILLAPAAQAQGVPGIGDIGGTTGGVTDTVGGTTGGATDTVGGTTGGVTDTVGGTTGGVTDTVGGVTDGATGTVGGTTGGVTDTVGGVTDGATGTVGGTTGGVTDTVDETADGVTETVGGTTGGVTDAIDEATGGNGGGDGGSKENGGSNGSTTGSVLDSGSTLLDDLLGGSGSGSGSPSLTDIPANLIDDLVKEGAANGMSPAAAEGWINGHKVTHGAAYSTARNALRSLSASFEEVALDLFGTTAASTGAVSGDPTDSGSFFASAGRAATTAVKAMAFPLALALLVVGFLVAQGRFGRSDPKLVLAPLDAREESLTFE